MAQLRDLTADPPSLKRGQVALEGAVSRHPNARVFLCDLHERQHLFHLVVGRSRGHRAELRGGLWGEWGFGLLVVAEEFGPNSNPPRSA